jgi:hypothetical protein
VSGALEAALDDASAPLAAEGVRLFVWAPERATAATSAHASAAVALAPLLARASTAPLERLGARDGVVAMREARDKTLDMPVLILPSVQVNMRAGQMPPPEDNGVIYLKIPINAV